VCVTLNVLLPIYNARHAYPNVELDRVLLQLRRHVW